MVEHPIGSRTLCTMKRAKFAVFLAYIAVPFLCIPTYFTFSVDKVSISDIAAEDIYIIDLSSLAKNYPVLLQANFWIFR